MGHFVLDPKEGEIRKKQLEEKREIVEGEGTTERKCKSEENSDVALPPHAAGYHRNTHHKNKQQAS